MRPARALLSYFALAFAVSWTGVLLAVREPAPYAPFAAMLLGPPLASIALTVALHGARGLRVLARRLFRWRVPARWYAMVLVAPAVLLLVLGALSRSSPMFVPTATTNLAVLGAIAGLAAGFFEELGWTGFAAPRLLRGRSWLGAGALLGVAWALWHVLPDWLLLRGEYGSLWAAHMLEWIAALVAYRVLMTWVHRGTRSLLLAVLMHATFTGSQTWLWPRAAPPRAELLWYGLFAAGLWMVVAIVATSTHRFGRFTAGRVQAAHEGRA